VYAGDPGSLRLQTVGEVGHLDAVPAPVTEDS
jgi:hypothetical protein